MLPKLQLTVVTLQSRLESVTEAETLCMRAAESAGFDEDECFRISMAVREGVINAFRWGNREEPGKKIRIAFELQGARFIVRIADEGSGFDLDAVANPLAEENLLKTSGRGIFLMRAFMDEWNIGRPREGGTELVMVKSLPASPNSDGSGGS